MGWREPATDGRPLHASEWRRGAAERLIVAGIEPDEARLEAEVLLRYVLGLDRAAFLARQHEFLPSHTVPRLDALLDRRLAREPLAYITGERSFFGLDFVVDQRVLVPRPETEGLVERAIQIASRAPGRQVRVADVGTGSGCIAVALALRLPAARVVATDCSLDALAVARLNAQRHGVEDRIDFVHCDLLRGVRERLDIIVANPPYIASDEIGRLAPEIARFEPQQALDGGADGLAVIRRLFQQAPPHLTDRGSIVLEIGSGQGESILALAHEALTAARVTIENDLAGLERYVTVQSQS